MPKLKWVAVVFGICLGTCMQALRAQMSISPEVNVGQVNSIAQVGDEIWLAGPRGVFRIKPESDHAVQLDGIAGEVYSLAAAGGEVWIGMLHGAFRVDRKTKSAVPVENITGSVYSIVPDGDEMWLGTGEGLFIVNPNSNRALRMSAYRGPLSAVAPAGGEVWIGTKQGPYCLERKTMHAVELKNINSTVYSIALIHRDIWVGAIGGLFRVDGSTKRIVQIEGIKGSVYSIALVHDHVWVGAIDGAYRIRGETNEAERLEGISGTVYSILPTEDQVLIGTEAGVLRVDPKSRIQIELSGDIPFATRLLGSPVWPEGDSRPIIRYVDTESGSVVYDSSRPVPMVIYDTTNDRLQDKLEDERNWIRVTPEGPLIPLRPGLRKLYFAVRDSWGNELGRNDPILVAGWVLPTWSFAFLLPVIAIGFCIFSFALAPYVRYCHMSLMNPFLRNWASFGTVPLLLTTVPALRSHILRRYRHTLLGNL